MSTDPMCHPEAAKRPRDPTSLTALCRCLGLGVAIAVATACTRLHRESHADAPAIERAPERIAPLSARVQPTPGEPMIERWPPGLHARLPGPHRHRLARLVQVTDAHIVDDESPARVVDLDERRSFPGAYRPQEAYACRVLDAVVRTINRMDRDDSFDAVVFGGDAIDNAQQNELDWFLSVVEGRSVVACDSGTPDDPVPGPGNDPKDPFVPEGLDPALSHRWYWVMGNHDILAQGNFPCDAAANARAVGTRATGGTIAWADGGAYVVHEAAPDPRRRRVTPQSLLERLHEHAASRDPSRGSYTVDIDGSPIRLLVVDTVARTGGAAGRVLRDDVDAFVTSELRRAAVDGKSVMVWTHHPSDTFDDGTSFNGHAVDGAVRGGEWVDLLASSGVVVALVVGHGHTNRVRRVGHEPHALWEIETSALADYPSQFRVLEVWDEDNGLLGIRSTLVDYVAEGNSVALEARRLSLRDFTNGESCCGPGAREDRNVILWSVQPEYRPGR